MDDLQEYDAECFPDLQTSLKLDGVTLEEMLKKSNYKPFCYSKKKQGWLEWVLYAGLNYLVLLHGKQKHFAWKDVQKWSFHHAKKLGDPDFEIWLVDKKERTKRV